MELDTFFATIHLNEFDLDAVIDLWVVRTCWSKDVYGEK